MFFKSSSKLHEALDENEELEGSSEEDKTVSYITDEDETSALGSRKQI